MYEDLSDKQIMILNFIKKELKTKGYPPAVREICKAVNLRSTSTVHGHLNRLEKKGYIRRDPTKPRAIEILENDNLSYFPKKEIVNIPIVGKVTAGQPILAYENIEDNFPLPIDFINTRNPVFMLRVKGDSMVEAGILDGDYVLVKQTNVANNGEIVVALIEDEATVKTFYKENNYFRLQPQNQYLEPIICNDVKILGKVIGVFRKI